MFKTKPSGQAVSARRSATVFCRYRDTRFNLDSHVVAVLEKEFLHFFCKAMAESLNASAVLNRPIEFVDASSSGDRTIVHTINSMRSNPGNLAIFAAIRRASSV
jgi:hypothetical protein